MKLLEFFDKEKIKYELTEHRPAFTAQRLAAVEHEQGRFVAKPVIVKADGKFVMCVLSASAKIDLKVLKNQLEAKSVELADESEVGKICTDCELGAEPPFGNLYGLTTIMDKQLENADHLVFQAGTHQKAVKISTEDYKNIAKPKVLKFSYHTD